MIPLTIVFIEMGHSFTIYLLYVLINGACVSKSLIFINVLQRDSINCLNIYNKRKLKGQPLCIFETRAKRFTNKAEWDFQAAAMVLPYEDGRDSNGISTNIRQLLSSPPL